MDKINLAENEKNGLSYEDIFKNFFKQIYQNKEVEDAYIKNSDASPDVKNAVIARNLERKLNNIKVLNLTLDPRIRVLRAYAVCSDEEIKKLLELGEEYLTVKVSTVKINKLKRHRAMKFNVYNINVNEEVFSTRISLCIIKEDTFKNRAEYAKDVIAAQDNLACAKSRLDFFDVLF